MATPTTTSARTCSRAEGVYFDAETRTIEPAGYKALVIYQNWLDADGALLILDWAKQGLPVFIMEHAAERTPFNDGRDEELANTIAELEALENVRRVEIYDDSEDFDYFKQIAEGYDDGLYEAMQEMGIRPYAEYIEPNHQLLTQSREDADGNRYLYVYNYCPNDYHENSSIESVRTKDHGTNNQDGDQGGRHVRALRDRRLVRQGDGTGRLHLRRRSDG